MRSDSSEIIHTRLRLLRAAVKKSITSPLIHVPINPITTMRKSLIKKAVQQMIAPAKDTDAPISR